MGAEGAPGRLCAGRDGRDAAKASFHSVWRKTMQHGRLWAATLALAMAGTTLAWASAADYSWPNNIPPGAKTRLEPLPLSPTGQPVPGFPKGPPAASPDV